MIHRVMIVIYVFFCPVLMIAELITVIETKSTKLCRKMPESSISEMSK
jgi:hypothetical protein